MLQGVRFEVNPEEKEVALMRRILLFVTVAAMVVTTIAAAGPGFANHAHYLVTPGTCVQDIASGQTSQTSGGGFHRFHENVHLDPDPGEEATPGEFAFAQGGQVEVNKVGCP